MLASKASLSFLYEIHQAGLSSKIIIKVAFQDKNRESTHGTLIRDIFGKRLFKTTVFKKKQFKTNQLKTKIFKTNRFKSI